MSKKDIEVKRTSIGGQALIEGVMMRGPRKTSMAVRHTSGEIRMDSWEREEGIHKAFYWKTPFIRGIFNFVDSLILGYRCLMKSVDMSGLGDEEAEELENREKAKEQKKAIKEAKKKGLTLEEYQQSQKESVSEDSETEEDAEKTDEKKPKKLSDTLLYSVIMIISSVLGVGLGIVLFMWLPIVVYSSLKNVNVLPDNRFLQSFFEGIIRIVIFIVYISLTALMKDIRRVYQYHGAEHKTIFCYEHGKELTVENVREESRFHPRCGTSFMILMLLIGIFISMLIPTNIYTWLRASIKILLLPIVMGIGYEAIKLAGRKDNWFTKAISKPGMWVQHITTKEPTDDMIECAIAAFKDVIPENEDEDKW
ncbi:MAG: DUF1385 domain-containing protein [Clostridia bacterium]|nr:DUF1385 domain-containing protein [Clostridia bacterium]